MYGVEEMLTKEEKLKFVQTVFEHSLEEKNGKESQKEILQLLLADTKNGKMYKYRTVNEYALSNLQDGTMYCAIPSSFNDPFDCKIGIDMQSLTLPLHTRDGVDIQEYFEKYIALYDGVIELKDCTNEEQLIFERWFGSAKINKFLKEVRQLNISESEAMDLIVNRIDVIFEILLLFMPVSDNEVTKQMQTAKEMGPSIIKDMSVEQKQKIFRGGGRIADYAEVKGINTDADEISLMLSLHQLHNPEQTDRVKKLEQDFANISRKLAKSIDKQYRVGCLCTDYKNRLMWSHYADGHRGICIEYDFNASCKELEEILILPVIYTKERIKFPASVAFATNKGDEKVKREAAYATILSLLTKDEVWNYENEWRVIALGGEGKENIKMPPISCIYVGAMCNDENKVKLKELADELKIPIKQMVIDRGEFTLHVQEY